MSEEKARYDVEDARGSEQKEKADELVEGILSLVKAKFVTKNSNYADYEGVEPDMLYNFRQLAKRQFGSATPENMIKVVNVLVDKHQVTLAKNGINDSEFKERVIDVLVYHVIALMIYMEGEA